MLIEIKFTRPRDNLAHHLSDGRTAVDEPTGEIVRLWRAVYGQPPVLVADLTTMVEALVEGLPEPTDPLFASAD